jgi:glycosyltransferase involved in cell wall biosynthesis
MGHPTNPEILLLYRGGTAGIIPTVANEARALVEAGFQVTLLTLGDPDSSKPHQDLPGVRVIRPSLVTRSLPKTSWAWALKYIEMAIRFAWAAFRSPATTVVAHDIDAVPPAWLGARLSGKKLVYFAIELYAERPGIPLANLWRWMDRFFARRVDATLSPQEDRTRFMIEHYGARPPLLTIRNVPYFDPRAREHRGEMKSWLAEQGIRAERVALYQGMLTPRRCVYELAEAAGRLDPGTVIVLIGAMTEEVRREFDRLRDLHSTRDRILLFGYVLPDRLAPLTASCDIGLVFQKDLGANTFHAAPIKMYQYFAAGLPVVGSNFPSLVSVLEDPERPVGMGADPENPAVMAEAINSLLADRDRWQQYRENALWLAENRYRYDLECPPMIELHRRLSESAPG